MTQQYSTGKCWCRIDLSNLLDLLDWMMPDDAPLEVALRTWYIAGNRITGEGLAPLCQVLRGNCPVGGTWLRLKQHGPSECQKKGTWFCLQQCWVWKRRNLCFMHKYSTTTTGFHCFNPAMDSSRQGRQVCKVGSRLVVDLWHSSLAVRLEDS